jgi:hypothetical protein
VEIGEERRWEEYLEGTPIVVTPASALTRVRLVKNASALAIGDRRVGDAEPPFEVAAIEHLGDRVLVDWSNGTSTRVREYLGSAGVLVEAILPGRGPGDERPCYALGR